MEVLTIKQKEKNREGNILVRRGGKEHRWNRRVIFGLQGRRTTEEEKEDNIWRSKKIREGKYRKYLEKENIVLQRRRRTKKNIKIFGEKI